MENGSRYDADVNGVLNLYPELQRGGIGYYNITALQVASALIKDGKSLLVSKLLEYGGRVNQKDELGRTALHYATLNGNIDLMEVLIDNGADVNSKFEYTASEIRKSNENYERWNKLFTMLPAPDTWGRTPLHLAAKGGHLDAVKLLISRKADPNALDERNISPLLLVGASNITKEKFEDLVEILVQSGANVNVVNKVMGSTVLFHAVAMKSIKATNIIIAAGAWISEGQCKETELHLAATNGSADILKVLLEDQRMNLSYVNHPDLCWRTPVYKAAQGGHKECLKLLIEHGGDLSAKTKTKDTVMDAIFSRISRPVAFINELLNASVTTNDSGQNDENFRVYLDFSILVPPGGITQTEVLSNMMLAASDIEKVELLQHPLIETYLWLKWAKIRAFFILLLCTYSLFVISLSIYVLLITCDINNISDTSVMLARYFVLVTSAGLLTYTMVQFILTPRHYCRQYEMWMNILCTTVCLAIATKGISRELAAQNKGLAVPEWVLHATSIAVLLAWSELMFLLGRFPRYGYYALMFYAVLQNVIKVLLSFVCMVVGFALSFCIQFHTFEQFKSPWHSLVKTTVMMTGEFEYEDLFPDKNDNGFPGHLPATSRIIFLMFIILASIVLMNLMIGLAVNDIQGLQKEGHARRLEKQIEFLSQFEKVVASQILNSIWMPRFLKKLFERNVIKRRKIAAKLVLVSDRLLAYEDGIESRRATDLPNNLLESLLEIGEVKSTHQMEEDDLLDQKSIKKLVESMRSILKVYDRIESGSRRSFLGYAKAAKHKLHDRGSTKA